MTFHNTIILSKFPMFYTCTFQTHNHPSTHSLVHFITLSVPVVLLKLKNFFVTQCTRGSIHTSKHKQKCMKNHVIQSFVLRHLDLSVKNVLIGTTCEIAHCISKQYCSINLNTFKVFFSGFTYIFMTDIFEDFLRFQYFFHVYGSFIVKDPDTSQFLSMHG